MTMKTRPVSQTSSVIAPILPIILCAQKYPRRFNVAWPDHAVRVRLPLLSGAFNWIVDNYPRLADCTASAVRVGSLVASLDTLEQAERWISRRIEITHEGKDFALRLNDLSVALDDGPPSSMNRSRDHAR